MYETAETTILKSNFIQRNKLIISQDKKSSYEKTSFSKISNDTEQCFTPILKTNKYEQNEGKRSLTGTYKDLSSIRNRLNEDILRHDTSFAENDKFKTPTKNQAKSSNEFCIKAKEPLQNNSILVINTQLKSNEEMTFDQYDQISNDKQILKSHLQKAKQTNAKLKDQNLKLRLEKIKLNSKNNEQLILIPFKVQLQKMFNSLQTLKNQKKILVQASYLFQKKQEKSYRDFNKIRLENKKDCLEQPLLKGNTIINQSQEKGQSLYSRSSLNSASQSRPQVAYKAIQPVNIAFNASVGYSVHQPVYISPLIQNHKIENLQKGQIAQNPAFSLIYKPNNIIYQQNPNLSNSNVNLNHQSFKGHQKNQINNQLNNQLNYQMSNQVSNQISNQQSNNQNNGEFWDYPVGRSNQSPRNC